MRLRVNKYKYNNTYFLILFYLLLSILHFKYIIKFQDFSYVSFYREVNFSFVPTRFLMASIVMALNFTFLLFFKMSDFLYSILLLILFFFVIPSSLVFASSNEVYPIIFAFHIGFFYIVYMFSLIKWRLKTPTLNKGQALQLLSIGTLIGIIPFVIEYGPYINLKNLLLMDVYDTRLLVLENVNNTYTAYTYSWFSKIIIPIMVIFSIYYRKYWKLAISLFALLFLFLCGAHKMVFAGLILLLLFYKYDYLKKTQLFLRFMTVFLIVSILASLAFDYDYIWDISFRRVLLLTALLDYCYFDFFQGAPIYWANSFLSNFIDYPYELSPDHMIGKTYFNRPEVNANIGIISDGYKNLGAMGSIINITIVALYISMLNHLRMSSKFFGLFVLLVFSFLNSSLTTILLTHGGILLLLLSMFVLRNTALKMDDKSDSRF